MIYLNTILTGVFFILTTSLLMSLPPLLLSAWAFSLSTIIALGIANLYLYRFPALRYLKLLKYAKTWKAEYKNVPIKSIILYRFYTKYRKEFERHKNFGEFKIKYSVVIVIDCPAEDFNIETAQDVNNPCRNFISETEYYSTFLDHPKHVAFIDSSFHEVYKKGPKLESLRDEWNFIPIKYGEKPHNVSTTDKWILYPLIGFLKK